jgi:hypothetical protein
MASARPPLESPDGPPAQAPSVDSAAPAVTDASSAGLDQPEPVSQAELNAWRRGFTPQAEIWNGRLAMVGLSVGLTVLIVARLAHHG